MKQRALTSLIIGTVYLSCILAGIYISPFFYDALVLFMMIFSGLEMSRAVANKFEKPIDLFVILNSVLGYACFYLVHNYIGNFSGGITAFFGQLFAIFLLCIIYNMVSKKMAIKNVISTMFVLIYPVSLLVYLLALNYIGNNFQYTAITLVFLISCFTDVFAYLVGRTLKGPKLAPVVSPKKTISGAVGGLLGGLIGSSIVLIFMQFGLFKVVAFSDVFSINLLHLGVIGLFGSVVNQLGDLIASYVKRTCEIKDYSSLLPGHGGVIDRVDGMMLVAVFVYAYITVFLYITT